MPPPPLLSSLSRSLSLSFAIFLPTCILTRLIRAQRLHAASSNSRCSTQHEPIFLDPIDDGAQAINGADFDVEAELLSYSARCAKAQRIAPAMRRSEGEVAEVINQLRGRFAESDGERSAAQLVLRPRSR